MVGIGEIKLGKSSCLTEPIQQLTNQKHRISVFYGYIVKIPIIYAKAETLIWLLIKEDRGSGGGIGGLDEAVGQVSLDVSFQRF